MSLGEAAAVVLETTSCSVLSYVDLHDTGLCHDDREI